MTKNTSRLVSTSETLSDMSPHAMLSTSRQSSGSSLSARRAQFCPEHRSFDRSPIAAQANHLFFAVRLLAVVLLFRFNPNCRRISSKVVPPRSRYDCRDASISAMKFGLFASETDSQSAPETSFTATKGLPLRVSTTTSFLAIVASSFAVKFGFFHGNRFHNSISAPPINSLLWIFCPDGHDDNRRRARVDVVEHPKISHPQLPRSKPVFFERLPIAHRFVRFTRQLNFDRIDGHLLVACEGPEDCRGRRRRTRF